MTSQLGGPAPLVNTAALAAVEAKPLRRWVGPATVWSASLAVLVLASWRPAWSGDEAATALVVRRSLSGLFQTFPFDPALEPYYLLLKLWSLPSTSELWLRLPSVLAMATAATVTWALTVRLAGRRAGVFAALLFLTLPATSRYAQDARPYALSMLLVALAVLAWDDERLTRSRRAHARLALILALVGLAHAYALLIAPVLLVTSWLVPHADRQREATATAACAAAAGVVLAPFLLVVAQRANGQANPEPVTPSNVVEELLRLPAGVLSPPFAVPVALAALGLAAAGAAIGWARGGSSRRLAVLTVAWLLLPPLALCLFQLTTGSPGLVARYWTFCLPPIALGGGLALDAVWRHSHATTAAAIVVLGGLAAPTQVNVRGEDGHLGQRWRELPHVLSLPTLREAALLVKGWNYRGLVSNDSAIASRMPLVVDPVPSGRVNPQMAPPRSRAFRDLVRHHDVVVALQAQTGFSGALPTRRSFTDFRTELQPFSSAVVLCAYFGDPLGVFTKATSTLPQGEASRLADSITTFAPRSVRCTVSGAN